MTYGWYTSKYDCHKDDIRVHMSDIRMTYKYIQGIYGWHIIINNWYTDDNREHTSDIRLAYDKSERQLHSKAIRAFRS